MSHVLKSSSYVKFIERKKLELRKINITTIPILKMKRVLIKSNFTINKHVNVKNIPTMHLLLNTLQLVYYNFR